MIEKIEVKKLSEEYVCELKKIHHQKARVFDIEKGDLYIGNDEKEARSLFEKLKKEYRKVDAIKPKDGKKKLDGSPKVLLIVDMYPVDVF